MMNMNNVSIDPVAQAFVSSEMDANVKFNFDFTPKKLLEKEKIIKNLQSVISPDQKIFFNSVTQSEEILCSDPHSTNNYGQLNKNTKYILIAIDLPNVYINNSDPLIKFNYHTLDYEKWERNLLRVLFSKMSVQDVENYTIVRCACGSWSSYSGYVAVFTAPIKAKYHCFYEVKNKGIGEKMVDPKLQQVINAFTSQRANSGNNDIVVSVTSDGNFKDDWSFPESYQNLIDANISFYVTGWKYKFNPESNMKTRCMHDPTFLKSQFISLESIQSGEHIYTYLTDNEMINYNNLFDDTKKSLRYYQDSRIMYYVYDVIAQLPNLQRDQLLTDIEMNQLDRYINRMNDIISSQLFIDNLTNHSLLIKKIISDVDCICPSSYVCANLKNFPLKWYIDDWDVLHLEAKYQISTYRDQKIQLKKAKQTEAKLIKQKEDAIIKAAAEEAEKIKAESEKDAKRIRAAAKKERTAIAKATKATGVSTT